MNTTNITPQSTPQLIKKSSTYKLIVPQKVEEKIRYLIRKFPSTEWSGVLFYSYQGTFEDNNLVITCEDIYPMDLGTQGWTEFHMSEDVAAYMAQNIELFDCKVGLVHSHHTIGAFFSGQDQKMLVQEGNDTNCFVSLVVDTKGTYVAAITRKVNTKSEVTIKNLGTSYEFFGEGTKQLTQDGTTTTKTIDKTVIEYYLLDVERHEVTNSLSYLDDRFNEIISKKNRPNNIIRESIANTFGSFNRETIYKEADLFGKEMFGETENSPIKEPLLSKEENDKLDDITKQWTPDPKLVHKAVVNIITCSLILDADKFDLKQWITKHMDKVYAKLFEKEGFYSGGTTEPFDEWKDFIIQFTLDNFSDPDIPSLDAEEFYFILASAIQEELYQYTNISHYVMEYYDALNQYLEY